MEVGGAPSEKVKKWILLDEFMVDVTYEAKLNYAYNDIWDFTDLKVFWILETLVSSFAGLVSLNPNILIWYVPLTTSIHNTKLDFSLMAIERGKIRVSLRAKMKEIFI